MAHVKGIWYEHMAREKWCPEYPRCSMFEQLKTNAQHFPELPAIEFQNKYYTFQQLIETIEQLAKALVRIGIKRGDIVSIITPNTPQGAIIRLSSFLLKSHRRQTVFNDTVWRQKHLSADRLPSRECYSPEPISSKICCILFFPKDTFRSLITRQGTLMTLYRLRSPSKW